MKQERVRLAVVIKSLMAAKTRNNWLLRRDDTEKEETITLKMIVTRLQAPNSIYWWSKNSIWNTDFGLLIWRLQIWGSVQNTSCFVFYSVSVSVLGRPPCWLTARGVMRSFPCGTSETNILSRLCLCMCVRMWVSLIALSEYLLQTVPSLLHSFFPLLLCFSLDSPPTPAYR